MLNNSAAPLSLLKIITIDYTAAFAFLFIPILWGFYAVFWIARLMAPNELAAALVFLGLTLPALLILIWRVRLFRRVFAEKIEAPAQIRSVVLSKDRCIVEYTYAHQGIETRSRNHLQRGKQPPWLQAGVQAVVMVDSHKPSRAFLRDLYLG